MPEQFPGHDHRTQDPGGSLNLPPHGFNINQERLTNSANTMRGIADLRVGLGRMRTDLRAYSSLDLAFSTPKETNKEAATYIRRGGILAHLLLADSVDGFGVDSKDRYVDSVLRGKRSPERQAFLEIRDQLMQARLHAIDPELDSQVEEPAFTGMVNEILHTFGVSEAIDGAIANLNGPGLEKDPTRLPEARYGAALILVGVSG